MRVLHLVTTEAYAGLERHVLQVARELRHLGCDAGIACSPSAARLRDEARAAAVPVRPLDGDVGAPWLWRLAGHVHRLPPDVLHMHDGRSAAAGAVLGRLAASRMVRTQHFTRPASVERTGIAGPASRWAQRRLNHGLDGYIAVSDTAARAAQDRGEIGRVQLAVIPPGVELADQAAYERAQTLRQSSSEPVVAYVGRLEAEKRLEVLIDAMALVRARNPACRFIIAGSGAVESDLKQQANRLGHQDVIDWPGWVADSSVILERSHVYVNPWPWEGFGMAMAEAMGFGLPVVAVDSGASRDMVRDGLTGRLVAPGDPLALGQAIADLLEDPPGSRAMGERAREQAVGRYGVQRTAALTLDLYARLPGRSRT